MREQGLQETAERQVYDDINLLALSQADQDRILAVWREANMGHATSHGAVAGQLTTWIFAILVTINLGGLALAVTDGEGLHFPSLVKTSLLTGLISTLAGGVAAMDSYNSAANKARLMSIATRETVVRQSMAASVFGLRQNKADKFAIGFLVLSFLSLLVSGVLAF